MFGPLNSAGLVAVLHSLKTMLEVVRDLAIAVAWKGSYLLHVSVHYPVS